MEFRNAMGHFDSVPRIDISRSRFNRPQNIKLTLDSGELVPFYVDEVLPNDTFQVDESMVIRMTTPKYPVMDNCAVETFYFYVPNRILWEHWKRFMGEADDMAWMQTAEYTVPIIKATNIKEGSILDYMGLPTKLQNEIQINALPVRAYAMIWQEWFRDQNVDNPAVNSIGDEDTTYTDTATTINEKLQQAYTGGRPLPVNKWHDYFTSTLPAPQRGPEVTLPMTGNATIDGNATIYSYYDRNRGTKTNENTNSNGVYDHSKTNEGVYLSPDGNNRYYLGADTSSLAVNMAKVNSATINQLRQAFQVQKYYEEMARGGSRYREILRSLYGAIISDKTVQIPEYLGGSRVPINVSQVIQTSQTTESSPQGNTGAMSVTAIRKGAFTKSFEEHGWIIGVMCIRHDHTYQQGIERQWSRKNKLDYYYPVFANLGEQAVLKKEIYAQGTEKDEEAFGYQEAWAEYRYKPNRISGKFRSNAEGTLDVWHYGDNYTSEPSLSQEWMKEGKEEIARTLLIQDEPQFIADILISNISTRAMPMYSVPGLIDHH